MGLLTEKAKILSILLALSAVANCNQNEKLKARLASAIRLPISQSEIGMLLQTTLDNQKLSDFLHPSDAGIPLRITGDDIPSGVILNFRNKPVEKVDFCKEKENCLWFYEIETIDSTVKIDFSYDIQGVRGEFVYFRIDSTWHLVYSSVVEN